MSTAPAKTESDDEAPSPSRSGHGRRIVILIAGAILCCAIAALVTLLLISTASDGVTSVLIGTLDSDRLAGLALIAALATLAAGLCLIPVPRLWLILLVPARITAVGATGLAGAVWLLTSSATVVPLLADGCETGYAVEEESFLLAGWGTVYRRDGVLATVVERIGGDDGYHPFADGAYAVADDGASLQVWYSSSFDYSAAPVGTDREPDFTIPKLNDRTHACGVSTGARTPIPPTPTVPAYDADEARAGLEDMVAASLAAAVSPVHVGGEVFDPEGLAPVSTACQENGTRTVLELTFETADNGASLLRILRVWDAAGYSADRAMQEDIRYSEALPVEKMSIRDSTTIDGLMHMHVTSQCSVR